MMAKKNEKMGQETKYLVRGRGSFVEPIPSFFVTHTPRLQSWDLPNKKSQ
jgi:hypothetical protein